MVTSRIGGYKAVWLHPRSLRTGTPVNPSAFMDVVGSDLHRAEKPERSDVGHGEPNRSVAQFHHNVATVQFVQRQPMAASRIDSSLQIGGQLSVAQLNRQLEVESQASCVPIRAADQAPATVNCHQLGMIERRRVELVDLARSALVPATIPD